MVKIVDDKALNMRTVVILAVYQPNDAVSP